MNLKKLSPAPEMEPPEMHGESAASTGGTGYLHEEPPTEGDTQQSFIHHLDSVRYNAKHAAAHQTEAAKHASALMRLAGKVPGLAKHVDRIK